MNYIMKVVITDPNTREGMTSSLYFELECSFEYNPRQYGNGYYLSIRGKGFSPQAFDLRYDKSFNPDKKVEWLAEWAKFYWSGKNGAWKVKTLEIMKV